MKKTNDEIYKRYLELKKAGVKFPQAQLVKETGKTQQGIASLIKVRELKKAGYISESKKYFLRKQRQDKRIFWAKLAPEWNKIPNGWDKKTKKKIAKFVVKAVRLGLNQLQLSEFLRENYNNGGRASISRPVINRIINNNWVNLEK